MSNGSKSVKDGWTVERHKEIRERADWFMHSIQSLTVSPNQVSKLAPPSGLRGSCVEAVVIYVTCL